MICGHKVVVDDNIILSDFIFFFSWISTKSGTGMLVLYSLTVFIVSFCTYTDFPFCTEFDDLVWDLFHLESRIVTVQAHPEIEYYSKS